MDRLADKTVAHGIAQWRNAQKCNWCDGKLTEDKLIVHYHPVTQLFYFFDDESCKHAMIKDATDTSGN